MTFKKENHTGRKIAVGSAIAGLAGYIAGVLTAPKSGQKTRQDISNKASDIKGDLVDGFKLECQGGIQ
jgi:gas vesicle protein